MTENDKRLLPGLPFLGMKNMIKYGKMLKINWFCIARIAIGASGNLENAEGARICCVGANCASVGKCTTPNGRPGTKFCLVGAPCGPCIPNPTVLHGIAGLHYLVLDVRYK